MLSRRDLGKVAAVAGIGPRRADREMVVHVPPGVVPGGRAGIFRGKLVIVFGTGFSGVFVYSPTPAAGNLIASIAASAGTDPYGNSYLAGITSYGSGQIAQLTGGSVVVGGQTAFQPGSIQGDLDGSGHEGMVLASGRSAAGDTEVQMLLAPASFVGSTVPSVVLKASNSPPSRTTTALLEVQGNINAPGSTITGGALQANLGGLDVTFAGAGLAIKEGANCKQGVSTLTAGTVLVPNTTVTAGSRIFLTAQDNNSTGALRVSARSAGTSFTITSSNAADSGNVGWEIFEAG